MVERKSHCEWADTLFFSAHFHPYYVVQALWQSAAAHLICSYLANYQSSPRCSTGLWKEQREIKIMNLNYESNDKIASEGSFRTISLGYFSSSPFQTFPHFYSLFLSQWCSLSLFFYFFFPQPKPLPLVTDDSTASIFHKRKRETRGERGKKFQTKITHSLIKLTRDSIKASLSKQEWYFIKWMWAIGWLHQATHL